MGWVKTKVLGKGSYGVVSLAVPVVPNLPYLAVKSSRLQDSVSLQKEQSILLNLAGSAEIVRCFGAQIGVQDGLGLVYDLILEYAAGGTLQNLITRGGCLPECEVRQYTRMILRGLCSIHAKGYVHCDLKPANILVFPLQEGINEVKIADFGLTKEPWEDKVFGNCSNKFRFRGTPIYMSPESVEFGEIETPLDIWSLGCIVVEMLTGKPAMQCANAKILMHELAFLKKTPRIPNNMSDKGKDFLMRCFAVDPRERWTAQMLLNHPYLLDEVTTRTVPQSAERKVIKPSESPMDSLPPPGWCNFSSIELPSLCDLVSTTSN